MVQDTMAYTNRCGATAVRPAVIAVAVALAVALGWSLLPSVNPASVFSSVHTHGEPRLSAHAMNRPRAVVQPVSSHTLPHMPGKVMTTVIVEFPPSGYSPKHHHGGSVMVYVLSGSIRSQLEGQPLATYGVGDSFFEPQGVIHLVAENASDTESARVLAVFVADEGATLTTYHE